MNAKKIMGAVLVALLAAALFIGAGAAAEAAESEIRNALGLLFDRNYIVEEIGQAGQVPAAGFVAMGLTEPDGKEFIAKNGPNRDGAGYYSVAKDDYQANCDKAVALLKEVADSSKKFTVDGNKVVGFPTLTYITNFLSNF